MTRNSVDYERTGDSRGSRHSGRLAGGVIGKLFASGRLAAMAVRCGPRGRIAGRVAQGLAPAMGQATTRAAPGLAGQPTVAAVRPLLLAGGRRQAVGGALDDHRQRDRLRYADRPTAVAVLRRGPGPPGPGIGSWQGLLRLRRRVSILPGRVQGHFVVADPRRTVGSQGAGQRAADLHLAGSQRTGPARRNHVFHGRHLAVYGYLRSCGGRQDGQCGLDKQRAGFHVHGAAPQQSRLCGLRTPRAPDGHRAWTGFARRPHAAGMLRPEDRRLPLFQFRRQGRRHPSRDRPGRVVLRLRRRGSD